MDQNPADHSRAVHGNAPGAPPQNPPGGRLAAANPLADDPEEPWEGRPAPLDQPRGFRRHRRGVREEALAREAEGTVPTDGLPWGRGAHGLYAPRLLTADDPRAATPPGFKGELYAPQATLLHAMLEFERRPLLDIDDHRCPGQWGARLQAKCGRISEKFSFGKTVLSLALVAARPVPARLPEISPLAVYPLAGPAARAANRAFICTVRDGGGNFDPAGAGFLPELSIRYARYLPVTVVAAAANVISQWEEYAQRFTPLRWLTVENVRTLRAFEETYRAGRLAEYDLVFVKAGRVTASFVAAGEPAPKEGEPKPKNRSLFTALSRVLDGVPVARLIIDDFDTLKLASDDCFIPALFTWLISATRRQTTAKAVLAPAPTAAEFIRRNSGAAFPVLGAALDDVLNKVCSLHCAPAYVDAHINSTAIGFRRVFVRGGQAAVILRALDVPEEVVEMINADAVGTAAQSLGIDAASVADVVRRVLGDHLDRLRHAVRVTARLARVRAALAGRDPPGAPERDPAKIRDLRAAVRDGSEADVDAALAAVSGRGKAIEAALAPLDEWAAGQQGKYGKALARMRDNIREGHCQCCTTPFKAEEEPDPLVGGPADPPKAAYVLAGCCQVIVCETCITRREGSRKAFIKRCPNCARDVDLATGLVRAGAELDLEAALRDESVLGDPPSAAAATELGTVATAATTAADPGPDPPAAPADPIAGLDIPKLKALLQLLTDRPVECIRDARVAPFVEGLLDGRRDRPWPPGKRRKFLVFTLHPESTRLIADALTRCAVPYCVLQGTRAQKDEAMRRIQSGEVHVLLATAPKDCAGLNMPFLSHVVFYHRVLDRNVEAQVAARGQRLGREYNLEIVALINVAENELR